MCQLAGDRWQSCLPPTVTLWCWKSHNIYLDHICPVCLSLELSQVLGMTCICVQVLMQSTILYSMTHCVTRHLHKGTYQVYLNFVIACWAIVTNALLWLLYIMLACLAMHERQCIACHRRICDYALHSVFVPNWPPIRLLVPSQGSITVLTIHCIHYIVHSGLQMQWIVHAVLKHAEWQVVIYLFLLFAAASMLRISVAAAPAGDPPETWYRSTTPDKYVQLNLYMLGQLKQHALVKLIVSADCLVVCNISC